jgi:hypothetical protein
VAVDFGLAARGLRLKGLSAVLAPWASSQKLELEEAISYSERGRQAFVFAPGLSIRGFSVEQTGGLLTNRMHTRIHACASSADWQLLFSFLSYMTERGAEIEDSGLGLSAGALAAEEAMRRWRFGFRRALRVIQILLHERAETQVWLPNPRFPVLVQGSAVPAGELPDDALHAIERTLVGEANGLARAQRDAAIQVGDATLTGQLDLIVVPEPVPGVATPLGHPSWPVVTRLVPRLVEHVRGTPPRYHLHDIEVGPPADAHLRQALVHDLTQPMRMRT